MRGITEGRNIWIPLKNAIKEYVNSLNAEDYVTFYTFALNVSEPQTFVVGKSKKEISDFIDGLEANGKHTCIYNTLKHILNTQKKEPEFNKNMIYLYTDGINNCDGSTMQEIADIFKMKRDDYEYLYYISLGEKVPDDVVDAAGTDDRIVIIYSPKDIPIHCNIQLLSNSITFNFSDRNRVIEESVPVEIKCGINSGIRLNCEFVDLNDPKIKLETENVTLTAGNTEFKIKIRIDDKVFFANDINAKVKVRFSAENRNVLFNGDKNTVDVKLILPKKIKSTIKFK
jgi:hypothetical protein